MADFSQSDLDVLQYLIQDGRLNLSDVRDEMKTRENQEILAQYKFWQAPDGRWRVYLPDETTKSGRRLVNKTHRCDLENTIIEYHQTRKMPKKKDSVSLRDLFPEWLDYKRSHGVAETTIMRWNTDWKRYYLNSGIIDTPIVDFTKYELDSFAHKLIREYQMTKTDYYNASIIIRQCFDLAVDKEILEKNMFRKVKVDGKRVFRRVKKKASETSHHQYVWQGR